MKRAFQLTWIMACAVSLTASSTASSAEPNQAPNVVFILADDLGWGDLSCYGNRTLSTPHLDRLAEQGTLFTQFYVNGSVCSPSRCAFFTGQYPARHRIHGHYATVEMNAARGMSQFLDPQSPNVAAALKKSGYTTAHVGKWHLGSNSGGPQPDDYGFDFVGSGEHNGANGPRDDPYYRAKSTEKFVDETIQFIRQHKDQRFYVQLWTLIPHATLNPTPEQMQPFERFSNPGIPHKSARTIYGATIQDLDQQVGRLIAALDTLGLSDKTLVLFSSDNGPEDMQISNAGHSGFGSAGPFRGRKRSLYEGGVRVPMIVRWPGKVPAGKVNDSSVMSGVDFLPTICGLAGAQVPSGLALDGEDFSDVLLGANRARQTPLFWEWRFRIFGPIFHHSPQLAVRDGDWKLYLNPDRGRAELYDIPRDPTQLTNLAPQHPRVVERLSESVLKWHATLPPGPVDPGVGEAAYPWPGR